MFKKELIICALATFFCLGFLGTAIAGEGDYKTVLGTDQYTFDSAATNGAMVAKSQNYDQEHLALVRTEAGDAKFKFDAPVTKADLAAQQHNYDQARFAMVGTEAGDSQFKFDAGKASSIDTKATAGNKAKPVCTDC